MLMLVEWGPARREDLLLWMQVCVSEEKMKFEDFMKKCSSNIHSFSRPQWKEGTSLPLLDCALIDYRPVERRWK